MSHITEGITLNKENTSELADTSKEFELKKDHKLKIERVNTHEMFIITSDGTRVKIIDQLDAHNGNIYLIDHVLQVPSSKKNENQLNQLHGYGRNSMSGGELPLYLSKAYENKSNSALKINSFYLLLALFILYLCCF